MDKRVRAIANSDNNIGDDRHALFSSVIDRINNSINDGYFLESIALLESLITDRLESRLSFLLDKNIGVGFMSISTLIRDIKNHESQDVAKLIIDDIQIWTKDRNFCIHQVAKIDINNNQSWNQQMKCCKSTAENGLVLFRRLDKAIRLPK